MRKLLSLAALVFCCPAFADWVFVDKSERAEHYIHSEATRKRGALVDIWQLTNLFVKEDDGTFSRRGMEQHDCTNKRWRLLDVSFHSEHWAGGKIIYSGSFEDGESKWKQIPPGTVGETIHKIVCKK